MNTESKELIIGIVGVCASGKSTLIKGLTALGYSCRHIAQEHSYVSDMWYRLVHPDILIYLDVSYEMTLRRKRLNWTLAEFETQRFRLRDALAHADILILTDPLDPQQLVDLVVRRIQEFASSLPI